LTDKSTTVPPYLPSFLGKDWGLFACKRLRQISRLARFTY